LATSGYFFMATDNNLHRRSSECRQMTRSVRTYIL
jgi:hypothetical protein